MEPLPDALNEVGSGDAESLGYIEQSLVQDSPATVLEVHEDVTRDAGQHGELFEGESSIKPQLVDFEADLSAATLPRSDPLGVILAGACRHAI